jgi:hypothetical protein
MFAGQVVRKIRTFAMSKQILLIALPSYAIGLVPSYLGRCLVFIPFQFADAPRALDFFSALACQVIKFLTDMPG